MMARDPQTLRGECRSFFSELKRRNVLCAAALWACPRHVALNCHVQAATYYELQSNKE